MFSCWHTGNKINTSHQPNAGKMCNRLVDFHHLPAIKTQTNIQAIWTEFCTLHVCCVVFIGCTSFSAGSWQRLLLSCGPVWALAWPSLCLWWEQPGEYLTEHSLKWYFECLRQGRWYSKTHWFFIEQFPLSWNTQWNGSCVNVELENLRISKSGTLLDIFWMELWSPFYVLTWIG